MHSVTTISKDLEPATAKVRQIEERAASLCASAGMGKVEFVAVEQAIRTLAIGGPKPDFTSASSTGTGYGTPARPGLTATAGSPRVPFTPESTGRGTAVPNAIYINGVPEDTTEGDLREVFARFGDIKMINSRHIATGGFAFIFFSTDTGAAAALEKPKVMIKGKAVNILAKKQLVPKERS